MEPIASPVVVALSNPETVRSLVGIGALMAQQREVPLHLGTILPRSTHDTMTDAERSKGERQAECLIRRGVRYAHDLGIENVSSAAEPARRVPRGIIRIVQKQDPALLVLGYSDTGDPFARSGRKFERLIDTVGGRVDCALAIVSLRNAFPFKRLFVPIASKVNLALVADIVPALRTGGATFVTFMQMVSPRADLRQARERLRSQLAAQGLAESGEIVIRATENVQRALVHESAKYDLTVVGAPRQRLLARIFGDTAERVARDSSTSVMIVRAER